MLKNTKFITRQLVKARDTQQALTVLKKTYPRAHIITYQFHTKIYTLVKEERSKEYRNRRMWVWFVKDIEKLKQEV